MKRMKSLHLFVVFASVALSYVILSACSSGDEYDMNNGLTLASGMMTRAFEGGQIDSVKAIVEKRTFPILFEGVETHVDLELEFTIMPNSTKGYNTKVILSQDSDYDSGDFTAQVSNIKLSKNTCTVLLKTKPTSMYGECEVNVSGVVFSIK